MSPKLVQDKSRVQAVQRALKLLQVFTPDTPEWGISDLSRKFALPKPVVFRLLATMEDDGFIERNSENQKYRLGKMVFKMAAVYVRQNDLVRVGDRYISELAAETCHSVLIGLLDGTQYLCLLVVPSIRLVGINLRPGDRRPAHATAAGKVLLSGLEDGAVRALYPTGELDKITSHTVTDVEDLITELHRVRQQGYAEVLNESFDGLAAVSAPIRDYRGCVVAGLSISWPTHYVEEPEIPRLIHRVIEVAGNISHQLGDDLSPERDWHRRTAPVPSRRT